MLKLRSASSAAWGRLAVVLAMLVAASVGGCTTIKNTFKLSPPKPTIPGERVSVLALEQKLEADPKLAGVDVALPPPYVNETWPQPGGYASHAMYHLAVADTLKRKWRADIGAGAGSRTQIMAPPVVAEGRVFALDAEAHVAAIDAERGRRLWRVNLTPRRNDASSGFGGGVAYDNGRVFVTTGFGRIHALDAATGKEIWVRDAVIPFHAAPTVDGGRIFAVSQDNKLHVLAADDGRELWVHEGIEEQAGLLSNASPAVSGDTVVVPYSSGELYAFRVQNGRMAWTDSLTRTGLLTSMETINDIAGRPVIDRDRVIAISHSGRLVSIDLRTGERVWTLDVAGVETPWVAGDYIFLVTAEAELLCVSSRDGSVKWITTLERYREPKRRRDPIAWSGPVLAGNRLIILSSRGRAYSVSPYTGEILGRIKIADKTYVPPVVANETLYILTEDATLTAMR